MVNQPPTSKIDLLRKLTNFMIGFLLNALLFGLIFKFAGGGWPGTFIAAAAGIGTGFYLIRKFKTEPYRKQFGTGALSSAIILTVIPILLWILIMTAFRGIGGR